VTTNEAFKYVLDAARELGYSFAEIAAFSDEIYERLNMMGDTDKDSVDEMIEELF
jgi:hypothetical protein